MITKPDETHLPGTLQPASGNVHCLLRNLFVDKLDSLSKAKQVGLEGLRTQRFILSRHAQEVILNGWNPRGKSQVTMEVQDGQRLTTQFAGDVFIEVVVVSDRQEETTLE